MKEVILFWSGLVIACLSFVPVLYGITIYDISFILLPFPMFVISGILFVLAAKITPDKRQNPLSNKQNPTDVK